MKYGKIAKLPEEIREQLNHRLKNGEHGKILVEWLNSIPEARSIIARDFGGKKIREQNLSEWRKRGYREWLERREAAEVMRSVITGSTELQKTRAEITDNVAVWLAARYFVAVKGMEEEEGSLNWRRMREFCNDLVKLRRGDHSRERLALNTRESQARSKRMAIREVKTLEHHSNISPKARNLFEQLTAEIAAHRQIKKGSS